MRRQELVAAILLVMLGASMACGSIETKKPPNGQGSQSCVVDRSKIGECTL